MSFLLHIRFIAFSYVLCATHFVQSQEIKVLALVAGKAVSSRQVKIDLILEDPSFFSQKRKAEFSDQQIKIGLDRYITQVMISEELKVVGEMTIPPKNIEGRMNELKKKFGVQGWAQFQSDYDLNESQIREKLIEKIQIERALEDRIRLGLAGSGFDENSKQNSKNISPSEIKKREDIIRKSIEDWVAQLKSRYRVQMLQN